MKKKFKFVDVECLAGNWDLAACREGFDIQHRFALPGGFGNECIESNRHLLGKFPITTSPPESWDPVQCDFLAGTPPCAGWSNLNTSKFRSTGRGIDSDIHACTWALIKYAAHCTGSDEFPGPQFVAFESVQQAFTIGRPLMEQYFEYLNQSTTLLGQSHGPYSLTHVLMSGATVGSASERRRYFWVAHRVPFGVGVSAPLGRSWFPSVETKNRVVTVRDAIDDLHETPLGDWPHVAPTTPKLDFIIKCISRAGWDPGITLRDACFRLLDQDKLPHQARKIWFDENMCWRNFAGPKVIRPDESAPVVTGGSRSDFLHYDQERFLTIHEMARLMDLPDEWVIPGRSINKAVAWIGKNAPINSLRWLTYWVRQSLLGKPGPLRGDVIDVTHDWKDKNVTQKV